MRALALGLLGLLVLLGGCAEMLRWTAPERPLQTWPEGEMPELPVGSSEYRVQPGDTLYAIAFRNNIEVSVLADWNNLDGNLIRPGQVLRLKAPSSTSTAPPDSGIRTYPIGTTPPEIAATPPAPEVRLSLKWRWPVNGRVLRRFAPMQGLKGLDIAAPVGEPVLATAAGKVVYSGAALKGYGELIIVKHDDVYLSAYGYNRRRLVREGDSVAPGQQIGEVGVGPEQKTALHFEIRERGKPVDPEKLLPSR